MKYTPADSTFFFEQEEKRIMEQFSTEPLAENGRGDNQRYLKNIFSLLDLLLVVLFKLA